MFFALGISNKHIFRRKYTFQLYGRKNAVNETFALWNKWTGKRKEICKWKKNKTRKMYCVTIILKIYRCLYRCTELKISRKTFETNSIVAIQNRKFLLSSQKGQPNVFHSCAAYDQFLSGHRQHFEHHFNAVHIFIRLKIPFWSIQTDNSCDHFSFSCFLW